MSSTFLYLSEILIPKFCEIELLSKGFGGVEPTQASEHQGVSSSLHDHLPDAKDTHHMGILSTPRLTVDAMPRSRNRLVRDTAFRPGLFLVAAICRAGMLRAALKL